MSFLYTYDSKWFSFSVFCPVFNVLLFLLTGSGLIVSETSFRSGPHLHKVKSALNHNKKKRHFHQNRLLSENPAVNQLYFKRSSEFF